MIHFEGVAAAEPSADPSRLTRQRYCLRGSWPWRSVIIGIYLLGAILGLDLTAAFSSPVAVLASTF